MDFNLISPERVSRSHGRRTSSAVAGIKAFPAIKPLSEWFHPFYELRQPPTWVFKETFQNFIDFPWQVGNCFGFVSFYASPWFVLLLTFPRIFFFYLCCEALPKRNSSLRLHLNFSINMNFFPVHLDFFVFLSLQLRQLEKPNQYLLRQVTSSMFVQVFFWNFWRGKQEVLPELSGTTCLTRHHKLLSLKVRGAWFYL